MKRLMLTLFSLAALGCGGEYERGAYEQSSVDRSELRATAERFGAQAVEPPAVSNTDQIELGRMLFFDPILSGNKDIACATCHEPERFTTDGKSLAVGTKAELVDGERSPGVGHSFMPRNARDLFNRGDKSLTKLFWDNRLQRRDDGRFVLHDFQWTESQADYLRVMPEGLDSLLAAQTMLPVLNRDEMLGEPGELASDGTPNELAERTDIDLEGVWADITVRVVAVPEYRALLERAYPSMPPDKWSYVQLANAIAAFIEFAFTLDDSPWDRFLRGEDTALDAQAARGAGLFFGDAGCGSCHSGRLLSDQQLHNIGVPPIGAGPDRWDDVDYGAAHRSHAGPELRFAFRTPPLRNVALTAPYMHNGAYLTLRQVVEHKLAPGRALLDFDASHLEPAVQSQVHRDEAIVRDVLMTISPRIGGTRPLGEDEIDAIVAFMEALTSPRAFDLSSLTPGRLPSGLTRQQEPGRAGHGRR